MKIASAISRYLLAALFLFSGSNIFLNFLHAPMPPGALGQLSTALMQSHYIYAICLFQVVPAILFLINRYVPLGLTLLAPVIVNICLVHIFMAPSGNRKLFAVGGFKAVTVAKSGCPTTKFARPPHKGELEEVRALAGDYAGPDRDVGLPIVEESHQGQRGVGGEDADEGP